ncbi:hypothetical protein [Ferruginibacter albus]|uniref:hypothetical protein n=1 Tax=Ferruginibacter albus TaxID=2875540 RepID=UPI001CC674B6|nr:hypothetical protein [Ferruginibacter albus]UAY50615.1 hypothetical protein K9M53_08400 [Ferruginibacter albus]
MKKVFLSALAVCCVTLLFSCKKDSTDPGTGTTGESSWTIDGKTNTSSIGVVANDNILSAGGGNGGFDIDFTQAPVAGTYTVVSSIDLSTSSQCFVEIDNENPFAHYTSTGASGDKVVVTIVNGKYVATFTNISMTPDITGTTILKASGKYVQTF